ncbi:GGDEF domain-containing protein [Roseobacter sp. CCS2]|uniref:GGDEF domain-containing protein n=1 Tax=Roseobacter sp. CCS2 TaxID=391593 RepID=UPI0000F403E3|nr:GGDEF domain-containing protein [Roseobacter sp. CCS2]EBA13716.1 hypothetical protein RCCS2_07504 [Roseobacter sp. CCS2]
MDQLMRRLAPKGWVGFITRLIGMIGLVAIANLTFAHYFDTIEVRGMQSPLYHIGHATVVGGPLIAFFLTVSLFQIRLQRRLWQLSRKDALTGLNNRRTFFELVSKARAINHRGVLVMMDADRFKAINDTHGHLAGDRCLKSISYTLQRNVRRDDVLARIGGEEFALYLTGATPQTARVIGERITKPITFDTDTVKGLSVTLSLGAAQALPDLSIDAVFARADAALYQAKQDGRARYLQWEDTIVTKECAQSA